MPPKVKVTKEEIILCALELVRKKGAEGLNARELAAEMGFSTQPPTLLAAALKQCAQGQVFIFLITPFSHWHPIALTWNLRCKDFGESWGKCAEIGLRRLLLHIPMAAALGPASSSRVCPPLGGRGSAPVSGA